MSILVLLLLTFLAPSACQGHPATTVASSTLLKENIDMLGKVLEDKVACDKMSVTDIFAASEPGTDLELLCKASNITWETRSCHRFLEGICYNLLSLVRQKSGMHRMPCEPGASSSSTSLSQFLEDLLRVLQRLVKEKNWQ